MVAAAKAYGQVKPYVDSAFSVIGRPGRSFESVLREVIGKLTSTPVPQTEPELEAKGLVYVYTDPRLEELSPAQKHLVADGAGERSCHPGLAEEAGGGDSETSALM